MRTNVFAVLLYELYLYIKNLSNCNNKHNSVSFDICNKNAFSTLASTQLEKPDG